MKFDELVDVFCESTEHMPEQSFVDISLVKNQVFQKYPNFIIVIATFNLFLLNTNQK